MKVLVIGGSSFCGVYFVDQFLADNPSNKVCVTLRNTRFEKYYKEKGIPCIKLDVQDKSGFSALDDYEFDAVVNYATMMPSNVPKVDYDDTADYFNVNVIGTLNILEWCRKKKIPKVISFGTRFDCRLYDKNTVITEETPLNYSYIDDHAAFVMSNNSKADVMKYYNEKYGMKNVFFRIPTIFGVGPHGGLYRDGVYVKSGLQLFMDKASKGEMIEVYGDVDSTKDLLYVKDLNLGVINALKKTESQGFFNIGYDENFKLYDVVKAIVDIFAIDGKKSQIVQRPDIPNNGSFPQMDMSKLKTQIGFDPKFSDVYDMFEDYKYELDRGVYSELFNVTE